MLTLGTLKISTGRRRPPPHFWHVCILSSSVMSDSVTPWTVARQAPLSMGFSRQEYWSELLCPPPGDLPDPGIQPVSLCLLHWQAGSSPLAPAGKPMLFGSDSQT